MIRDLRASYQQNHPQPLIYAQITRHNRNVRNAIHDYSSKGTIATPGKVVKQLDGIQTQLRTGDTRRIFVKTYRDGGAKVWEEQ